MYSCSHEQRPLLSVDQALQLSSIFYSSVHNLGLIEYQVL